MAAIVVPLSDERLARLRELARGASLTPEELLQSAVEEWLGGPTSDFARAADYVLRKNAELYRRLA